jgi:hypothetical protein
MKISRTLLRALPLLSLLPLSVALGACSESADGGDGDGDGDGDAGDGDGGDGDGPYRYCSPAETCPPSVEGVDLTTPVSFRNDLYGPYLQGGCGETAGCHGYPAGAAGIIFGTAAMPLDDAGIAALINQLKTDESEIAPPMKNVVPGDWQNSFLMTKLDGCQNDYGITCSNSSHLVLALCGEPCGDGMPASEGTSASPTPFATTPAERAVIHKIRAWIAQGAPDN